MVFYTPQHIAHVSHISGTSGFELNVFIDYLADLNY